MMKKIWIPAAAAMVSAHIAAAEWPANPVTIVVPFAPGQTGDIIARLVAKELQGALKQSFVVDNRAGGGGRIGTAFVAKAKPDGYTLLLTSSGPFAIAPALYPKSMSYDPAKSFAGVADIASTPQVIAASAKSDIKSFASMVSAAKTSDLSYGSAGNGSLQHLTMELLKTELKFPMVHVAFKGSSESKTAVIGNQLPLTSDSLPAIQTSLQSGQLRALAVVDEQRSPYLPNVPTVGELGYPGLSAVSFFGLVTPKATPREVVQQLNKQVAAMLRSTEFQNRLKEQALTPSPQRTPEEFDAYLASEINRWQRVVTTANVQVE